MTQEDVAFEAEMDRPFLSQIENGIHQPTVGMLFRIARALSTSASAILAAVEEEMEEH